MKIILVFLTFAISCVCHAGVLDQYLLAPLSQSSYRLHMHGACPGYSEEKAQILLRGMQSSCPDTSRTALPQQAQELARINDHVTESAEDKFFSLLGRQQVNELRCASDFAKSIHNMSDNDLGDQLDRLKLLRIARKSITDSSMEIATNFNISEKLCPLDLAELKNEPPYRGGEDVHYSACRKLISNRSAYSALLASFPLSNRGPLSKMLDRYSSQKDEPSDAQARADLRNAYASVGNEISSQAGKLESTIGTSGGAGLDRLTRHVLLQDPRVVSQVLRQSGDNSDVRGIACRADARYGTGADALNVDMTIATFALGAAAGTVSKIGSIGMNIYEGASAARAGGVISLSATRMIQASALAANGTSAYSTISNACFSNAPTLGSQSMDNQNQCVAAPKINDLATDSCVIKSLLVGLSLEASAPSVAREMINKFVSTPAKISSNASLTVGNLMVSGATGLPSATAITVARIKYCENPPCLKQVRYIANTRAQELGENDLNQEQRAYLSEVVRARSEGKIKNESDVSYWLTPNNGGAGTIGQYNTDRSQRPFQAHSPDPIFPKSVKAEDVVLSVENGRLDHVSSADGKGDYVTNFKGVRYHVQICEDDACRASRTAAPLSRGDILSVTPVCGADLRRVVTMRKARDILLRESNPTAEEFYEAVPCR